MSLFAKNDPISKAAQNDNDHPSIIEIKAIAEEGFIFGLPLVMSYAIMYAAAVDPNSLQFKAPSNQIKNEAHVYTYKDTSVPLPLQRHALLSALHGLAHRTPRAVRTGC
jgi:hypothetical protein